MISVYAGELVPGEQIYLEGEDVPVTFLAFNAETGVINFEYADGEEDWIFANVEVVVDRM